MRTDTSELLTLSQAADAAGVSVQTFRVYVASGGVASETVAGRGPMFRRDAVKRVAKLQEEAIGEVRHAAVEKLAAELVAMREAIARQSDSAESLAGLTKIVQAQGAAIDGIGEAIVAERRELEAERKRVDGEERISARHQAALEALDKRLSRLESAVEGLAGESAHTRSKLDEIGTAVAKAIDSTAEQSRAIEDLRVDQEESHARIRRLVDKLADAFGQVRSAPEPGPAEASPEPPTPEPSIAKAVVEAAARAKAEDPMVAPAKVGIVREIEFNYLMERMGYRRLDAYAPEELVAGNGVAVPDDDTIREFLSRNELGCSSSEVEISPVTRGGWQMIQYQRITRKGGKRAWIGAKR